MLESRGQKADNEIIPAVDSLVFMNVEEPA
jgi:hypothetical protein